MSGREKLVVNVSDFETRVAIMEANQVAEVLIERTKERGIVGNIYLGKVQRVLPGMQAAFVEIGLEKAAFLYVGDVLTSEPEPEKPGQGDVPDNKTPAGELSRAVKGFENVPHTDPTQPIERESRRRRSHVRIEDVLKSGEIVMVQVVKDSIGTKGPRVTCSISLPGRHLVFMPKHDHIGVSRRITEEEERERLKAFLAGRQEQSGGGYVVRTISAGTPEEKLGEDADFLVSLWRDIEKRAEVMAAPALVHPELDLVLRCARDMFTDETVSFVVDDDTTLGRVEKFMKIRDATLLDRLETYEEVDPIFEHYGVETELARAMRRKVWLKSGGYLVIDQAEALTAIDVNTGRFVGKRNLEETIVRTNLEAVVEVADQLRLRNIGGMVIIDFIDMEAEVHREQILAALEVALQKDRARCNVVKMSELGLVEMTRQRTRESLGRRTTESCWYCEGRGNLKSKTTLAYDIFRALVREAPSFFEPVIVVQAHPEVADLLYGSEAETLERIREKLDRSIIVRPRGSFHQEQFDIFGTSEEAIPKSKRNKSAT